MEMPLVSVAIITYNQVNYIEECIESVLQQDYPNIEIVVGDDGSTDGTQAILKKYAEQYPAKFFLQLADKNYGITANSNAVHFACTGKYIAWMGGDDIMLPTKIRKQVAILENDENCNIVYHNISAFDSDTQKHLYFFNNKKTSYKGDVTVLIKHGTFNGACSTMLRRSAAPKHGFDTQLHVASDWLFWVEVLIHGGTIKYINEVLSRYRRHNSNVTKSLSPFALQANKDNIKACEKILNYNSGYAKIINYRLSNIYTEMRRFNYIKYLSMAVRFNIFNFKAIALLLLYILSIGFIKK